MPTQAPQPESVLGADERAQPEAFIESNRAELVEAVFGLTDEQARRRLVASLTTPLGRIKHATYVEQSWFELSIDGRSRAEVGIAATVEDSFMLAGDDTVASVVATFHDACATSRRIAGRLELNELALHNRRGPLSLRWLYLHMIEELARHAGHAESCESRSCPTHRRPVCACADPVRRTDRVWRSAPRRHAQAPD